MASSLNNLAALYYAQGQYVKAEPLYQRALAIDEKALGCSGPFMRMTEHEIAGWRNGQACRRSPSRSAGTRAPPWRAGWREPRRR